MDDQEASGKAAVYASQSGETGVGGVSRTLALEQLSVLSFRRNRAGAGQRGVDGDFVSGSCRLKVPTKTFMMLAVRYPPLQKTQGRAPTLLVVSSLKAWATRHSTGLPGAPSFRVRSLRKGWRRSDPSSTLHLLFPQPKLDSL
jgi:hypothetical protein